MNLDPSTQELTASWDGPTPVLLSVQLQPFAQGGMHLAYMAWSTGPTPPELPKVLLVLKELSQELIAHYKVQYGEDTEECIVNKVNN